MGMTDAIETPENTGPETADTAAVPSAGADVPPDRLAINPRSAFFDAEKLGRGVGIRFKGTVRNNVEEYFPKVGCASRPARPWTARATR
jgi:hypothetical protein